MQIGGVRSQLGNFMFFPNGFRILLNVNMSSVINEIYTNFSSIHL